MSEYSGYLVPHFGDEGDGGNQYMEPTALGNEQADYEYSESLMVLQAGVEHSAPRPRMDTHSTA